MREELERSSIGPTHRGTGFDSLLAHFGAVAQSGEHLVCTQAVVGSMPTGSTCFRSSVGLRAPGCGPGGRGFDSLREHCVVFVQFRRGIDQVADRRAHTPEAVGSNPIPQLDALVVEPPVDTPASEAGARDEHASSTLARGTATSRWLER